MLKRRLVAALAAGITAMGLYGCGDMTAQEKADVFAQENAITVQSDGSVTAILADSFGETYYQSAELESMINSEAAAFNTEQGADSLRVDKVEVRDGRVSVTLWFSGSEAYTAYTGATFFVGTVAEARENGMDLTHPLYDFADSSQALPAEELAGMDKSHVLIMDTPGAEAPIRIETFGPISHASEGIVKGEGKNSARLEAPSEGLSYIIFK